MKTDVYRVKEIVLQLIINKFKTFIKANTIKIMYAG